MKKDRAVICDLDGTVIDTERVWDTAARTLLGRRGKEFDREHVKPLMMGKHIHESTKILLEKHGIEENVDDVVHERRELVREILAKEVRYIPGADDFIRTIKATRAVAIATALERTLIGVVDEALKLSELFDGHVYSIEEVGNVSKPNPDIFLYAAKKVDVAPEHCIVLEDAPLGVQAAKNAGMTCIALTTTVPREKLTLADKVVDSYAEIQLS